MPVMRSLRADLRSVLWNPCTLSDGAPPESDDAPRALAANTTTSLILSVPRSHPFKGCQATRDQARRPTADQGDFSGVPEYRDSSSLSVGGRTASRAIVVRRKCVRPPLGCWKERSVWVAYCKHPNILLLRGVTVGLAFRKRRRHSCCVVGEYRQVETGRRDGYVGATSRLREAGQSGRHRRIPGPGESGICYPWRNACSVRKRMGHVPRRKRLHLPRRILITTASCDNRGRHLGAQRRLATKDRHNRHGSPVPLVTFRTPPVALSDALLAG